MRVELDVNELQTLLVGLRLFEQSYGECSAETIEAEWPGYFRLRDGEKVEPLGLDDVRVLWARLNDCLPAPVEEGEPGVEP